MMNAEKKTSSLEDTFLYYWKILGIGFPMPEREYKFHPKRKWPADFCWPDKKIIVECEGGTWSGGRHVRGKGYSNDCKKYNAAQTLGYKVFRATCDMLKEDPAGFIDLIKLAM